MVHILYAAGHSCRAPHVCVTEVQEHRQTCHVGLAAEAHLKCVATAPTGPRLQVTRFELQFFNVSRTISELMVHYFCR